jgi:hypothetical protein
MVSMIRPLARLLGLAALLGNVAPAAATTGIAVRKVAIFANGARSSDETAAACRRFQLAPADVRTFFAYARRVNARAFHHDLSMSRCHAAGTLKLASGTRARWFIDLERRGSLRLTSGRVLYYYCMTCRSAKFDEVDDDDRATAEALFRAPGRR